MCGFWAADAVRYWSESTPIAHMPSPASTAGVEHTVAGRTGGVEDHVGAVVVHRRGGGLAAGRVVEAAEVGLLDVLHVDLDVRVDGLDTGVVAGLELLDQVDVDAADEADVVGLGVFSAAATPTRKEPSFSAKPR